MSKKKTEETHEQTTEESTVDTPQPGTPPVEPAAQSKPKKSKDPDYVCPACKHTSGVKIGAPYQKGELTLQYVQCEKCHHISAEIV